jgi:hypothetical protein
MRLILILSLLAALSAMSCSSGSENKESVTSDIINNPNSANGMSSDTSDLPRFEFTEKAHDFGVVVQGEKVAYSFKFRNVGKANLVISSVHASCGCTVPKYSTKPVSPGGEGEIEVIFDSSGREGAQVKTITVTANTQPSQHELNFTAEVVVPEK